jgi:hypothetical protein
MELTVSLVCYRICKNGVKSNLKKKQTLVVINFSLLCIYLLGVKCMILFVLQICKAVPFFCALMKHVTFLLYASLTYCNCM